MTDALRIALDLATITGAVAMMVLMFILLRECRRDENHVAAAWALLAWAVIAGGWAAMLAGEDMLSRIVIASFAARFN